VFKLARLENLECHYRLEAIHGMARINHRIVKVLEGSQPAFVKRRLAYHIK